MAPEQTGNIVGVNGKPASEADMKFMANFVDCMIGKPNIDWDRLTKAMGLKDAKCTKERWRQIQKKLGWDTRNNDAPGANGAASPGAAPTPGSGLGAAKTNTPRKRKATTVAGSPATPSKVARRGGAKGKAAVGSDRDDDLMPDSPAVAKKSPAQGKGKAKVKSAAKVVEEDDEDDEDEAKGGEDGFSAGFVRHKIKDEHTDRDLKAEDELLKKQEEAGVVV